MLILFSELEMPLSAKFVLIIKAVPSFCLSFLIRLNPAFVFANF